MAPIQDQDDSESLFHVHKIAQWVSLPPASLGSPLPALCASVFSPLLLTYYPPAKGIVLAWRDVQVSDSAPETTETASQTKSSKSKSRARRNEDAESESESEDENADSQNGQTLLLKVIDEYSAPFLWATATLLVLRPRKNAYIAARITQQASTHITLSYLNAFSVSVVRSNMPEDWVWCSASATGFSMTGGGGERRSAGIDGAEGYWMDGEGRSVEGVVRVRIEDWDARGAGKGESKGFLRIEGSLIGEENEAAGASTQKKKTKEKAKAKKSSLKSSRPVETEAEAMEID